MTDEPECVAHKLTERAIEASGGLGDRATVLSLAAVTHALLAMAQAAERQAAALEKLSAAIMKGQNVNKFPHPPFSY